MKETQRVQSVTVSSENQAVRAESADLFSYVALTWRLPDGQLPVLCHPEKLVHLIRVQGLWGKAKHGQKHAQRRVQDDPAHMSRHEYRTAIGQ